MEYACRIVQRGHTIQITKHNEARQDVCDKITFFYFKYLKHIMMHLILSYTNDSSNTEEGLHKEHTGFSSGCRTSIHTHCSTYESHMEAVIRGKAQNYREKSSL